MSADINAVLARPLPTLLDAEPGLYNNIPYVDTLYINTLPVYHDLRIKRLLKVQIHHFFMIVQMLLPITSAGPRLWNSLKGPLRQTETPIPSKDI